MLRVLAFAAPLLALQAAAAEIGELPFSDADLGDALRARGIEAVVRVDPTGDGEHLRVRTDARERVLVIGDRRGPEAARLVAQEVCDLLLEVPPADLPEFLLRAVPSDYLSIYPSFGVSVEGETSTTVSATVDLDVAMNDRFRFAVQLAGSTAGPYTAETMRLSFGAMFGPIELRAGSVQSLIEIYGGTSLISGVQGALLARFTLTGSLELVTELGADKYLTYAVGSAWHEVGNMGSVLVGYSSPDVVVRSGVGLAWAW